jgi:ketosteroid isomerase-like protein
MDSVRSQADGRGWLQPLGGASNCSFPSNVHLEEDRPWWMTVSQNVAVVLRYFDACNNGDLDELKATLHPEVVHYFLPASFSTIKGAEHLARYWRKYKLALDPVWKVDRIVGQDDQVVSEWSCLWTDPASSRRVMSRGTEWDEMRDGLIAEVRAYFVAGEQDSELPDFPYAERLYLTRAG